MSGAARRAFSAAARRSGRRCCSGDARPPRPAASAAAERLHSGLDALPDAHVPPTSVRVPLSHADHAQQPVFADTPLIFDTHRMIAFLRQAGFSQTQSEGITDAMVRVSQHANKHHQTQMVTKNEFVSLRSELSILEKADFALLKTDINAIEKRMETSVAEIYTAVERVENRVIKWVIAVAGAIGLAIIRLTTTSPAAGSKGVVPPPASNVSDTDLPRVVRRDGLRVLIT